MNTLDKSEKDKQEVEQELMKVDAEIAESTLIRPSAAEVQRVWSIIPSIWGVASEDDRMALLQCIINEIIVTYKNRVTLKLKAIPEFHGHNFAHKKNLGAGACLKAIHDALAKWLVRRYVLPRNGRH